MPLRDSGKRRYECQVKTLNWSDSFWLSSLAIWQIVAIFCHLLHRKVAVQPYLLEKVPPFSEWMIHINHRYTIVLKIGKHTCIICWHWKGVDGWKLFLTHWGRDKMAVISQTTFSNVFSSMKMCEFRLKFHWSLFPRVQSKKFKHWFR